MNGQSLLVHNIVLHCLILHLGHENWKIKLSSWLGKHSVKTMGISPLGFAAPAWTIMVVSIYIYLQTAN